MNTEKRYANIEREMLAVVVAREKFHSYLFGKRFLVESDHKPFEMIHLNNLTAAAHDSRECYSDYKDMIWKSSTNLAH